MDGARFYSGKFLLAMPGIGDQRFERSMIAMCSHDEDGALGVGIGQLMPRLRLHDILDQLDLKPGKAPNSAVHYGGPVEPQRGFVLHSQDWGGQGTTQVGKRWSLSSSIDVLRAITRGMGPSSWIVSMGYAGWSAGQLDGEMTRHGWHLVDGDPGLIFSTPVEERWIAGFRASGVDPALLTSVAGSA